MRFLKVDWWIMFQLLKLRKRLLRILSPFKLSLSPNIFSISKIFTYTWWIRKKQRVMILYIATQQHSQTSMLTIIRYKSNEKLVKYIKTISSKNKYVKFWLFSFTMLELYNIMQWECRIVVWLYWNYKNEFFNFSFEILIHIFDII